MMDTNDTVDGLIQDLRRGAMVLAILSQLSEPQYGYSLVSTLEGKGIDIDPGTLYPLLRRLEKQELLESKWDTNEARPRKYYLLSLAGRDAYRQLQQEWSSMVTVLDTLIGGKNGN
jgi:PadR family transcriptional regulator PadR